MSVLTPPSLIENTLSTFGVETISELLDMDIEEVANTRGVGKGKVDALRALKTRARSALDQSEPFADEPLTLIDELSATGVDLDQPWAHILTRLNQRARTVFEREGLLTLRDLVLRYESGSLKHLPGFGEGTERHLGALLERLITQGLEYFLFGEKGQPQSTSEVISHFLEHLGEEDRQLMELRFVQQETLEKIAQRFELTREAIRQRIDKLLEQGRAHYGELLNQLLHPLLELLEHQGGLVHIHEAIALGHEQDIARLMLALSLQGTNASIIQGVFLSTLSQEDYNQILQQLQRQVSQDRRDYIPISELNATLLKLGVKLPKHQLAELLQATWEVPYRELELLNPWLETSAQYGALLKLLGRAIHLDELTALIQQRYELEIAPQERHIYMNLQRNPEIYYVERGTYAHKDALPLPLETLQAAAAWSIQQLIGTEHAVSASIFIPDLVEQGLLPHEISSLLLRDLMGRDPRIQTFQSTDFVAHLDSFLGHRKTQEEHVSEILLESAQPMTCDEVCAQYPTYLTCHRSAIYTTLSSASFSLNLPQGRFIHRESIGLTAHALSKLLDQVTSLLIEHAQPITATCLLELLASDPSAAYLQAHPFGSAILWSLARERSTLLCGRGELMMIKPQDEPLQDPLTHALLAILEQELLMTPTGLRREIVFRHSYLSSHGPIYSALDKAEQRGLIKRVLLKYRALSQTPKEALFAYILDRELELPSPDKLGIKDLQLLYELYQWSGQDELAEQTNTLINSLT